MAILIKDNVFQLDTANTSYVFCVTDGYLEHLYYGAKIPFDPKIRALGNRQIYGFAPYPGDSGLSFLPAVRLGEYAGFNSGDFRLP